MEEQKRFKKNLCLFIQKNLINIKRNHKVKVYISIVL